MKKLLFLLIFVVSCSNPSGCHKCKGYSIKYDMRIQNLYHLGAITYTQYKDLLNKAYHCENITCDGDYCDTHK